MLIVPEISFRSVICIESIPKGDMLLIHLSEKEEKKRETYVEVFCSFWESYKDKISAFTHVF